MIFPCKPNRVARTYLGGHRIDALRGIEAEDGFYPEEWIASVTAARNAGSTDPNEGLSFTRDGKSLVSLLENEPAMLGNYEKLPILLKLLDASERLVIQAHPTVEFAKAHLASDFGKAECWYIIEADPGAHVYLGFREGVTREAWEDAFRRQDSEKMLAMLHKIDLEPGDIWYVDGGVPHAIGGGCLMAELQEPTDLMVVPEMYTPSGRRIADERMHCGLGFEKSFDVYDYTGYSREALEAKFYRRPTVKANEVCHVIDESLTDKFRLDEYKISGEYKIAASGLPSVAIVIGGEATLSEGGETHAVKPSDSLFIPANAGEITVRGELRILIATP